MKLNIKTKSDGCFGSGEGLAAAIDLETAYERDSGLPRIPAKTIKGLVVEAVADLIYAAPQSRQTSLRQSAEKLFGNGGSHLSGGGVLRFGDGRLPEELRQAILYKFANQGSGIRLTPQDVLDSLTAIRRQTAIDDISGVPDKGSLRSLRLVLRETEFSSEIHMAGKLDADDIELLCAGVLTVHRGGAGRNRGKGRMEMRLFDELEDITEDHAKKWVEKLKESI